jgi:hypothetical protein
MILLERERSPVVSIAIRLHDDTGVTPEEIDLQTGDLDVHLGGREAMTAAEGEEQVLELAAGGWSLRCFVALELCLSQCPSVFLGCNRAT